MALNDLQLKDDLDMIIDGLYIGNIASIENLQRLKMLHISHIITCAFPSPDYFSPEFEYLCLEMVDDQKARILVHLPKAIDFIDRALAKKKQTGNGGVLVMSTNGKSRPVSIVISYLMYMHKMSLANSLSFVKLKRSCALPNANFMS